MRFASNLQRELYYRAQIDYCYYRLEEIMKSDNNKSLINRLIDKATGFDKIKSKKEFEECLYLLGVMKRCKNRLGYDTQNESETILALRKTISSFDTI
jgi:hypothetical protein